MSAEFWAIVISAILTLLSQQIASAKTRGEFRSVMRNYPPHRHQNGTIAYSAEYPPTEVQRSAHD